MEEENKIVGFYFINEFGQKWDDCSQKFVSDKMTLYFNPSEAAQTFNSLTKTYSGRIKAYRIQIIVKGE